MSIDINKLRNRLVDSKAAEILVFEPTRDQSLARANFWAVQAQQATPVPQPLELATALSLGAYRGIEDWWTIPGFPEWFSNQDEFRQKLEFLSITSLDVLEKIRDSAHTAPAVKVNVIKLIMELSKKLNTPDGDTKYLDQKIAEMDRKQLEQFIQSRMSIVPPIAK